MRKKLMSLIIIFTFVFTFSVIKVNAEDQILGETLVYKYDRISDLPVQFVKDSDMPMYEYDGNLIYDFRDYFEVYDNAQTILNMHAVGGEIDLGGYVWEMNFEIGVVGEYQISLSYEGVTGLKSETITVEVILEDVEGPEVFISSGNFNKTRLNKPEEFQSEFNNYLRRARVYDKVDGVISVSILDFDEQDIEALKVADLGETVVLTLVMKDRAGNETTVTISLKIVDLKAPNIHNAVTVTTKKGKRINFRSHLSFSDNYSEIYDIETDYEVYSTLVVKNIWEKGSRRLKPNEGKEIKSYLKLENEDLDSYLNYLNVNSITANVIGDYHIVVDSNGVNNYFYISEKELVDDTGRTKNIWSRTTNKTNATGKKLGTQYTFLLSSSEFLDYVNTENEEGFKVNDFYQVLDLTTDEKYFVYIKETENIYRDKHEQPIIDFNNVGVYYVKVIANDEAGNTASAVYRVVVADGLSLMEGVLLVNLAVLVVAAVGVVVFIVFKRRQ